MTKTPRKPKCHECKCWPEYYNLITRRMMEFQVRKADKDYTAGDTIHLSEYDPKAKKMTGNTCILKIILLIDDLPGMMPGYIAFVHRLQGGKPAVQHGDHNMKGIGE